MYWIFWHHQTLFRLFAVHKPLLDFLLCNKHLQNQGITNWGTYGTPAFHGSHQYPFLKKCTILHCILNHPNFFLDIFLTPNLSWETFGIFCIEIITDKEIAKRLQIMYFDASNEKSAQILFRSTQILPVIGHQCCPLLQYSQPHTKRMWSPAGA